MRAGRGRGARDHGARVGAPPRRARPQLRESTGGDELERFAREAAAGDSAALSRLVEEVQHPVYRPALRFLGHPEDAKDATQEVLVRLITHLGQFEGRSEFTAEEAEYLLLSAEVRISCTYAMLLCLSRPLRASYTLGDAMGMPDIVAAEICRITRPPSASASPGHAAPRAIIAQRCGLIDAADPCRCSRQIQSGLDAGILDRDNLVFATHPRTDSGPIETGTIQRAAEQLDLVLAMGEVYRSDPSFAAPREVWERVKAACPDLLA